MPGFRVIKRQKLSRWGALFILFVAIVIALGLSGVMLLVQDKPLKECCVALFQGGFGGWTAIEDTLLKTIPIFLCSLGVAVAFRMKIWNIGAEGQFAMGAVGATWAVLMFPELPMWAMLPMILACAAVAGGFWGFVPGLLRERFRVNEIVSTLMLNYLGILFLQYLVYGPWKDPESYGFPMTAMFPDEAIFPNVVGRVHAGVIICVAAALILAIFFKRTKLGFELRISGENPSAAQYARIPYKKLGILVMIISGILAGFAGGIEVSATFNRLQPNLATGYGYTAIVVAWLSRLRISSIAFFSFFLAGLRVGMENLQIEQQVPAAFGGILEGLILLTVLAGQFFHMYSLRRIPAQNNTEADV